MNYRTAIIQLPLVRETKGNTIKTPDSVSEECNDLRELAQETFSILCLNSKNGLINRHLITLGLVDASLVHTREVFRAAINDGASGIILTHNHPSGDPSPSADDIRITKQLVEAGKIVDIKILDHVILGGGPGAKFISLREDGVCRF